MQIYVRRMVQILVAGCIASAPAHAQDMMALRSEATIAGDIVRLGDLVESAGDRADIALFRSPALGGIGTIRADRIAEAVRELGLAAIDMRGLPSVTIRRPSRQASTEEIIKVIRDAISATEPSVSEAMMTLDPGVQPLLLDQVKDTKLSAEILFFDAQLERFEARISGARPGSAIRVTGRVELSIAVAALVRPLSRGEAIQANDLLVERRKRKSVPTGALIEPTNLIGLVARRTLRAGDIVRDGDVVRPNLVEKNQLVTVVYEAPGLSLALRGKALGNGLEGAIVSVMNLQTKRTLEAVVIGPGRVSARLDQQSAQKP